MGPELNEDFSIKEEGTWVPSTPIKKIFAASWSCKVPKIFPKASFVDFLTILSKRY